MLDPLGVGRIGLFGRLLHGIIVRLVNLFLGRRLGPRLDRRCVTHDMAPDKSVMCQHSPPFFPGRQIGGAPEHVPEPLGGAVRLIGAREAVCRIVRYCSCGGFECAPRPDAAGDPPLANLDWLAVNRSGYQGGADIDELRHAGMLGCRRETFTSILLVRI